MQDPTFFPWHFESTSTSDTDHDSEMVRGFTVKAHLVWVYFSRGGEMILT